MRTWISVAIEPLMYNDDLVRFQKEGRKDLEKEVKEFIVNWLGSNGYPLKIAGAPKTVAQLEDERNQQKLFDEVPETSPELMRALNTILKGQGNESS